MTPVRAEVLDSLLRESNYDRKNRQFVVNGFRRGFEFNYEGPKRIQQTAPNLKIRIGSLQEIWLKVMTEVKSGRYAGPFESPPFKYFIQSPIGLVPKDHGTKTRLIFHLSYPRDGNSVNAGIPNELCSVNYPDFNDAVKLCIEAEKEANMTGTVPVYGAKSDMSMAFRQVPMSRKSWKFLFLKAQHPVTGKYYFFLDKNLPFGSSISCKIFQEISDSIAHIVQYRTHRDLINYLDDYFFVAWLKSLCDEQVEAFLAVCSEINFPVALQKTFWGTTILIFLGLLLDMENKVIRIPMEKITKTLNQVEFFLNTNNKKATVLQIQRLCGSLNFLCKCVVPGRTFTRRLYSTVSSKLKPHHHIHITRENRMDLTVWKQFLIFPGIFNRNFLDLFQINSEEIDMYSDAAKSWKRGFSAYCGTDWTFGVWPRDFIENMNPSIEFLELYGVAIGVLLWIRKYSNKSIAIFCDNKSVCDMLNATVSSCKHCMILIRLIVLECMIRNVKLELKHVRSEDNGKADALSRLQFNRFRELGPNMKEYPEELPNSIWPVEKLWFD